VTVVSPTTENSNVAAPVPAESSVTVWSETPDAEIVTVDPSPGDGDTETVAVTGVPIVVIAGESVSVVVVAIFVTETADEDAGVNPAEANVNVHVPAVAEPMLKVATPSTAATEESPTSTQPADSAAYTTAVEPVTVSPSASWTATATLARDPAAIVAGGCPTTPSFAGSGSVGVTADDGAEAGPVPALLVALTVKV